MRQLRLVFILALASSAPVLAQQTGASDYALGGSSVMWSPGPAALFLNPAELARLHQSEFGFNGSRITQLASFSGAVFFPSLGSLGGGVSVADSSSAYSLSYALPIGRFNGIGIGLTGFRKTQESIGFSFGASLHFPHEIENSGFHVGASVVNLSENTSSLFFSINLGVAYWILDDELRVQLAYQHSLKNYALLGVQAWIFPWMSAKVGTRSFEEVSGGLSFPFNYASVDVGLGKRGIVLSVRAALSSLAIEERNTNIELAQDALSEERFADALNYYRKAIDYDPYFTEAVVAADTIETALKSQTSKALAEAANLMAKKDFVEATKAYSRILRMDPDNDEASENLRNVKPAMRGYINQLIQTGDSLRDKRDIERARRSYEQAQELDPDNDSLATKIASLEVLAKVGVRSQLSRAKTYLDRNQLDEAQREYERVLAAEPRNGQALQGLASIRAKRREAVIEKGKELFSLEKYMDALKVFLDVLKEDNRNAEVKSYVDRSRQILRPMAENYFRSGLQYYTKENYKAALDEWDKTLLINPDHQGTNEYRKRAEEKLKALEKLK